MRGILIIAAVSARMGQILTSITASILPRLGICCPNLWGIFGSGTKSPAHVKWRAEFAA
jgi:hypothetical protein